MKKAVILSFSVLATVGLFAQNGSDSKNIGYNGSLEPDIENTRNQQVYQNHQQNKLMSTVLWSEDFASGFTNSTNGAWTTSGANANMVEYDTDGPDNLIQFGWGPLPSPTAGNGFAIFDWYDNFPDPNGFATSPAQGKLTSPVIQLTPSDTAIEIKWHQQIFWCCEIDWEAYLLISTDGGNTFTDSVVVNWVNRNDRHWNLGFGYEFTANISDFIKANPTNIVLQFDWTSLTADQNGQYSNAYFWMIDDIELRELPDHSLNFNAASNAPSHDMVFNGDGLYSRYGSVDIDQIVPIEFDANMFNYGKLTQTNAALEVEIWDVTMGSPTLLTSLSTPGCPSLAPGDTCDFNNLTTQPWTPPSQPADYLFVYKAISDSISSSAASETDTFSFSVTEYGRYSLDNGTSSGFIGTNSLDPPMASMGVRYSLENQSSDTNASPGLVYIDAIQVGWSAATDSTGDFGISIFDTTGFTFGPSGGFPATSNAIFIQFFQLNGNDVGTTATYSVVSNNRPLKLPANTYYLMMDMFVNATDGVIRVANDATWSQPARASVMQRGDGTWFGLFTNSRAFNAPFLRLVIGQPFTNLSEDDINSFSVYPNPIKGYGHVEFEVGGNYDINVMDMVGNRVITKSVNVNAGERISLDMNNLSSGFYLVNVRGEGLQNTTKISVK